MRWRFPLRFPASFQAGGVDDALVTIHQHANRDPSVVLRSLLGRMIRLPAIEAPSAVFLMNCQSDRPISSEHMVANDGSEIAREYGLDAQTVILTELTRSALAGSVPAMRNRSTPIPMAVIGAARRSVPRRWAGMAD